VKRAKYELGFMLSNVDGSFTNDLRSLLLPGSDPEAKPLGPLRSVRRRSRLRKAAQTPIREKAWTAAYGELGTHESPADSNIVKYSEWYGITGPWCAMFTSWCYVTAGSKRFARGTRYAYCPYVLADARGHRNGLSVAHPPERGDLVLFDWDRDGVPDHIGLFGGWLSADSVFTTVEGNTSAGNQSNGGEVQRRERGVGDTVAFIRVEG